LAAAYLKRRLRGDPFFSGAGSLLTIHNMAYQGNFPAESLELAGFGGRTFPPITSSSYGSSAS